MSATEPPPLPLRKRETFTAVDPEVENVVEEVHVDSQQASAAAAGAAAHEIESISNSKSTAKSDTLPITAMHYEAILRLLGLRHETPAQLKERLKREREEDDRYLSKLDQVGQRRLLKHCTSADACDSMWDLSGCGQTPLRATQSQKLESSRRPPNTNETAG